MIKLYEKGLKTFDNPYGVTEVDPNILLQGPCMICLSAQPRHPKSIYGIIREGMEGARLRTSQGIAGGFSVENFPVKFLGISHEPQEAKETYEDSIAECLKILISQNGTRLELETAKRNIRNITFMTYCDGTDTYIKTEKKLEEYMLSIGYSEEEIHEILSQVALIPIQTDRDYTSLHAQTINFQDTNDREVEIPGFTTMLKNKLEQEDAQYSVGYRQNNKYIFFYNGTGNHSVKASLDPNSLTTPCLSTAISMILENSIQNHNDHHTFHPLDMSAIARKIRSLIIRYSKGMSVEEIQQVVDDGISYNGTRKITPEEHLLLLSIDKFSAQLIAKERELSQAKYITERNNERLIKLENGIKSFCSPITYQKIQHAAGFQYSQEVIELLNSAPSDREIIEELESQKKL